MQLPRCAWQSSESPRSVLMMPSEVRFSLALYGPWHIDDLYKLKIDQLYFGFP